MLEKCNASANLAVRDIAAAQHFYHDVLGLEQVEAMDGELLVFRSGATTLNIYRSDYAGTNQATAVTWVVGDEIDDVARELREKGITFEHYDMPEMHREGDIHVAGDVKVAWFKDPDGNILNIVSG